MHQIFIRDEKRILLKFPYNSFYISQIRTIKDAKYNPDIRSWHIPYNKESWSEFKNLQLGYVIFKTTETTKMHQPMGEHIGILETNRKISTTDEVQGSSSEEKFQSRKSVMSIKQTIVETTDINQSTRITYNNDLFYLSIQYTQVEIDFVKSLEKSWWNRNQKMWIAKGSITNLELLQERYAVWSSAQIVTLRELIFAQQEPKILHLYLSPQYPSKCVAKLSGFKIDVDFFKHIPERDYNSKDKIWIVPFEKPIIDRIIVHYASNGTKIINRLPQKATHYTSEKWALKDLKLYLIKKYPKQHSEVLNQYIDTLIRQRYSSNTIKNYVGNLVQYILFLGAKPIDSVSADETNAYLSYISKDRVSESFINTAINAIKFYYTKVVFLPNYIIERIKRPRKSRMLPGILSIQEVDRLLRSTENIKHVSILYTLYGHGLRLNEVLQLRVQDIHWDRNQLFVRSGKGKKDRYVGLSQELKLILTRYFDEYMPQFWLFEGQDKEHQYSERSVQQVVKQAARKAKISRPVTPHTLRHCYATHLLDGGVQLPYIQELLGHKDIKTTLIYTHVTTANMMTVESPLDKLRKLRMDENPQV